MTAAEALEKVRGLAAPGRYVVSQHARQRMRQRGVREGDLRHALENAHACSPQADDKWKVDGPDLDGDELTVVVVIDDGLVVVTLF
ncbi:MAG: DUF4258 domain-containing protein [Myxococcota bacterium]